MAAPLESTQDLTGILTTFREQYVAATVQQEELLRLMLDVQNDFRHDCATMFTKLLDNKTSSLIEQAQLPDTFVNGNEARKLPTVLGCDGGPQVSSLQQVQWVEEEVQPDDTHVNEAVSPHRPSRYRGCSRGGSQQSSLGQVMRAEDSALNVDAQRPSHRASGSTRLAGSTVIHTPTSETAVYRPTVTLPSCRKVVQGTQTTPYVRRSLGKSNSGILAGNEALIQHPYFLGVIYTVIIINAVGMGMQVDLQGGSWDTIWKVLDYFCTAIFIIEAIIKIYILRAAYFRIKWNIVDFLVVCSAILDVFLSHNHLTVLRMLRLGRLTKILQMKNDLMVLIGGIVASLKAMFWVCVLMLLIIYAGAILCAEVMRNETGYDSFIFDNRKHFGSLGSSMMTLFSIAILDDTWSEVVWPVSKVQPYMLPFFAAFLVITSFGLMNAFIGIVVERIIVAARKAKELDTKFQRQQKLHIAEELVQLVEQIDCGHTKDGWITVEELDKVKDTPPFKRMIELFDFPPGFSLSDLHMILDDNSDGRMSGEEFIDGMFKMIFRSTSFHNQCMHKLAFAQIRQDILNFRSDFFMEMATMREQCNNRLRTEFEHKPAPWQTSRLSGKHHDNDRTTVLI